MVGVRPPSCSTAERGTNPGNWEMARPVETCRICSKVVVFYLTCELIRGSVGASPQSASSGS